MRYDREKEILIPETFDEAHKLVQMAKRIAVWVMNSPTCAAISTTKKVIQDNIRLTEQCDKNISKLTSISLYLPKTDRVLHFGN